MTNSLCVVCKTKPKDFIIVEQVLVCCTTCEEKVERYENE